VSRWYLFLVLAQRIAEFVWKCSWLLTAKFINKNLFSHGRGKISTLINIILHRVSRFGTTYSSNGSLLWSKYNSYWSPRGPEISSSVIFASWYSCFCTSWLLEVKLVLPLQISSWRCLDKQCDHLAVAVTLDMCQGFVHCLGSTWVDNISTR
jgi:hypothetical protein